MGSAVASSMPRPFAEAGGGEFPAEARVGLARRRRRTASTDAPGIQRSFMVWAVALRTAACRVSLQCSRYQLARSPPCDLPQVHSDRFGSAVSCRHAHVGVGRKSGGVLLVQLQGILRELLQKEPGSGQVSDPAAALPGKLHPPEALALHLG